MTPKVDGSMLTGVSETALLTLNGRAHQAGLPGAILHDPMAIQLRDSFDVDFDRFGRKGQEMALRSLAVDGCAIDYLRTHPEATVVALAEGFQTSFWRLDAAIPDPRFRWVSIDLPPVIELRNRLLPASPRITSIAQSALDYSWMDHIDSSKGVFITAEGLLMYLQPDEALALITECAARFPGGQMMFDLPPSGLAALTRRGLPTSLRYRVPPMPFTLSVAEAANLVNTVPGVRAVHDVPSERGRGTVLNALLWTVQRVPLLDPVRPVITLLEFG